MLSPKREIDDSLKWFEYRTRRTVQGRPWTLDGKWDMGTLEQPRKLNRPKCNGFRCGGGGGTVSTNFKRGDIQTAMPWPLSTAISRPHQISGFRECGTWWKEEQKPFCSTQNNASMQKMFEHQGGSIHHLETHRPVGMFIHILVEVGDSLSFSALSSALCNHCTGAVERCWYYKRYFEGPIWSKCVESAQSFRLIKSIQLSESYVLHRCSKVQKVGSPWHTGSEDGQVHMAWQSININTTTWMARTSFVP